MAILANNGLIPIHPLTLVPNYCVGTSVYLWNDAKGTTIKFLGSDEPVTDSTLTFLIANPHQKIFIEDTSYGSYENYLDVHLEDWLVQPRIPRGLKTAVIAEYVHGRISKAYLRYSITDLLNASFECAARLAHVAPQIEICGLELQRTLRHDASFQTHATNTAFYSFLIAESRGYDAATAAEIFCGAMLHDIGKIDCILFASGRDGRNEVPHDWTDRNAKTHPTEGFRRLCQQPGITETHLFMCYQHHERADGKGFPVGLVGDEIHDASKICSVANRYDGLTSHRLNRTPMSRLTALRVMETEKNSSLDSEILQCLDRILTRHSTN